MAMGNIFVDVKNKMQELYNRFFYENTEAPAPQMQEEEAPRQQDDTRAARAAYQQPVYQNYQQPSAQNAYQQSYGQPAYQQPVYSQPAPVPQQQPQYPPQQQAQPAVQGRFRRAAQHAPVENNVVDFGAYQQQGFHTAEQAAPETSAPQGNSLMSARIINARGMAECRSAITLLRGGEAVVVVMEGITDPAEMRRLVDTLSGACYSLTATITKVSRYGVYLLAPQTLTVYADQATNMMNSAPTRAQVRPYQGQYAGQRVAYAPQQYEAAPQQGAPQPAPYGGNPAFTQRAAAQEEAPQNFYQRPAPQSMQPQGFSTQPAGYGYAPDDSAAVDQ